MNYIIIQAKKILSCGEAIFHKSQGASITWAKQK